MIGKLEGFNDAAPNNPTLKALLNRDALKVGCCAAVQLFDSRLKVLDIGHVVIATKSSTLQRRFVTPAAIGTGTAKAAKEQSQGRL